MSSKRVAIEIKDTSGVNIFSNFTHQEFTLFQKVGPNYRAGSISKDNFSVRMIVYSDDLVSSARLFKKHLVATAELIQFFLDESKKIEGRGNQNLRRLVHNLTTYNALAQQEIEVILPQDQMISKMRSEQIEFVSKIVHEQSKDTAEALLKISKYTQGIKAEISSFDKLFKSNPDLKIMKHEIRRVIMNTMYLFFPDFTDKQIAFKMNPSELACYFDYESVNVALYHLVNNAAKYCLQDSTLEIKITDFGKSVRVTMFMTSLRIEDSEKKDIFKEGYSGIHAKSSKLSGSGVGMYLVKSLFDLNKASIDLQIDRAGCIKSAGYYYDKNLFVLDLPASRLSLQI